MACINTLDAVGGLFVWPSLNNPGYGLALNLAGIETRRDDGLSAMTVTRFDLPPARIALGADPTNPSGSYPSVHTMYQQLHNYPVGASGKERKDDAKGNKYNITPVRREFLADLRVIVVLDFLGRRDVEAAIRASLSSDPPTLDPPRYGLPFLGDNAFLLDKIEVRDEPVRALWYRRIGPDPEGEAISRSTRLTTWIDRQDMSKTQSALFAPTDDPSEEVPDSAWTDITPPVAPKTAPKTSKKG